MSGERNMLKTSRFVARYIRDVSRNKGKRTKIMNLLENDTPFEEETVGAVALIDISGFTALTSTLLAQQGRRSSEEMTQAVSKFMSKIIDIISYYGGDVIKFLGDALLIVFESKSGESELRYTTRRALICCTEVLIKGKTKSVTSARTAQSPTKKKAFEVDEDLLDLHIGLSAGCFHHVIVGVAGQRCDYFVHGPPLGEIGGALDNARPGELGIARSAVEVLQLPDTIYSQIKIRKYEQKGNSQTVEFKSLEILQAQLSLLEPARLNFLEDTQRKPSEASQYPVERIECLDEARHSNEFSFQFMNQSLVHKIRNLMNSNRLNGDMGQSKFTMSLIPTQSLTRSEISTSMVKEEDDDSSHGPSSEYRRVTIMFIKFRFSYTKMRAHQLFSVLIKGLKPYDGVTQQFSVDDKGQSFFAVFGLPPWSHENNAVFAVRAAITVSELLKSNGLTPFTIGLSTGDLLFSHMGSNIRSEAGLLGDVVNVAARLMIFNKAEGYNIFCDYDTHEATTELYHHAEIGLHMLKGKLEPVSIWAIKNSKIGIDNLKVNHKDRKNFGYADEKAKVNSIFSKWMQDHNQAVLIVEGPSGMGKTSLLDISLASMNKHDAKIIVIRGAEIERLNPLYSIRSLMRSVYQVFSQLTEAEKAEFAQSNQAFLPQPPPVGSLRFDIPEIIIGSDSGLPNPPSEIAPVASSSSKKAATKKRVTKQVINSNMINVDESFEGIRNFVTACGLNDDLIPILFPVMEWVDNKDTPATKNMTPEEKQAKLRTMIVHIVKSIMDHMKIAVLCDDLQFMDHTTLELLSTIIQTTKKSLYFLFSRPFAIYHLTAIESSKNLPYTTLIKLNGLSVMDTQKMLVWKFRDIGATSLDKELLRVIHVRSSGSPFFLDKLADTLLATLPRVISCDEKGMVATTVSEIDYQEILAINVESAILVTFDQLDHHFQELLRVASVCGMYFDFNDVSAVIDGNYPPDDLISMAQSLDLFSFLTPCPDPPQQNRSQISEIIPEGKKKYRYCFTHILISNTIYGSQPFGHRQEIHKRLAKYLEEKLTIENRASVLPSIAFHYSNTSDQDKMYVYFEMLGLEYVDRYLFQEGVGALGKLIHLFEAEKKTDNNSSMPPTRQAVWYAALAYAETGRKSIQNARKHAIKALSLIEASWPETDEQYNNMLKHHLRKQNMLWLRTIGGRLATGEANPEKDKIMFRCLSVLHNLAMMDPTLPPKDIPLINTHYLNLSIACGQQYRPEFVDGCFKSAEWQWLSNNKHSSHVYLNQGKKLSSGIAEYESFLNAPAALCVYKGDFPTAVTKLELCAKKAKTAKDMATYHMNQVFLSTVLVSIGKLEESYSTAKECCKEVEANEEHMMTLLFAVPLEISSVFCDKADDATRWATLINLKADYAVTALSRVFSGACCIFHLRKGDSSKALDKFQDMVNAGMTLMTVGQRMPMQLFGYCSIFPFLYFSLEKDPDSKKLQALIETLNTAVNIARKLWLKPCVEGAAAYRMYLAAHFLLQGKPDLGISVITKAFGNGATNSTMKSMGFIYGLHLAVAGRFSTNPALRSQFADKALMVLTDMGAKGLGEWAKGGEYGF